MPTILSVCITCKRDDADPADDTRPGTHLLRALHDHGASDDVEIREVSCLSACSNGCAVALSEPGKWSYVYGRMTAEDAPDILAGAAAYAVTDNGLVPWRDRPVIFRKQSLARIPPFPTSEQE
ncbi:DUF1636 family protein [Celeribacter neptunius]|uniref:Predicted metal-binding protein n=1 Tax=Celeribacter neptunius TaxID=588602 RepID=A0A1I3PP52_9RHOB|nr:DUF1636 domain-containing protein [Celeribacter neptunius]SFJ23554.1 Predicted metal-binding protein [Celeribacter neptunius]